MDVLTAISTRRSVSRLVEPAPSLDEVHRIIAAAMAAPDHGRLQPWRFVALAGAAKESFGDVLAEAYRQRCRAKGEETIEAKLTKERTKLGRAPLVLVIAATPRDATKVPVIEQFAAAAAALENALLAATALGYGSMWRTGDVVYDATVKAALGLRPVDQVVGFVYLGTVPEGGVRPRSAPPIAVEDLIDVRT